MWLNADDRVKLDLACLAVRLSVHTCLCIQTL